MYNTSIGGFIGRFHDSLPLHLVENLYSGAVICPINQVDLESKRCLYMFKVYFSRLPFSTLIMK